MHLARTEMTKHGLVNWRISFIKSKSVAGLCWTDRWDPDPTRSRGRIELSTDFFDIFEDHDIIDTIRHEIAHALTKDVTAVYKTGERKGQRRRIVHGADWKTTARRIGCVGQRCIRAEAARPTGRYKGVCPAGHEVTRHRLTWTAKHGTSCAKCSPRVFRTDCMFDWYDRGQLTYKRLT